MSTIHHGGVTFTTTLVAPATLEPGQFVFDLNRSRLDRVVSILHDDYGVFVHWFYGTVTFNRTQRDVHLITGSDYAGDLADLLTVSQQDIDTAVLRRDDCHHVLAEYRHRLDTALANGLTGTVWAPYSATALEVYRRACTTVIRLTTARAAQLRAVDLASLV